MGVEAGDTINGMSRLDKLISRLLAGNADQTFRFDALCALLNGLGFVSRHGGGSHRIFYRDGIPQILNLQPRPDGTAKPYQVRQARQIILRYRLAIAPDPEAPDEP